MGCSSPRYIQDGKAMGNVPFSSDDRTLNFNPCCHSLQTIPGTCIAVQNAAHVTLRVATPPHSSTGPKLAASPDLPVHFWWRLLQKKMRPVSGSLGSEHDAADGVLC